MSRERELLRECHRILADYIVDDESNVIAPLLERVSAILSQPEAEPPKLDAPAKVGGGSFSVGVAWKTVIKAAQRSYEYELSKKKLTHEEKITEEMNRRELFDTLHNRDQSKTVYGVLATAYLPSQTDALHNKLVNLSEGPHWIAGKDYCDMRDHARSLERQRDELRAENEELRSKLNKGE